MALQNEFADFAGAADVAVVAHRRHSERAVVKDGLQVCEAARSTVTEFEAFADDDPTDAEAFNEDPGAEFGGRQRRELGVESDDVDNVDAGGGDPGDFFVFAQDERRREVGREDADGMRVKGDDAGSDAVTLRECASRLKQRVVAAVQAIEIANRDDGAAGGIGGHQSSGGIRGRVGAMDQHEGGLANPRSGVDDDGRSAAILRQQRATAFFWPAATLST